MDSPQWKMRLAFAVAVSKQLVFLKTACNELNKGWVEPEKNLVLASV
jgi:hypothetical protein